jgi:hypothetical protein
MYRPLVQNVDFQVHVSLSTFYLSLVPAMTFLPRVFHLDTAPYCGTYLLCYRFFTSLILSVSYSLRFLFHIIVHKIYSILKLRCSTSSQTVGPCPTYHRSTCWIYWINLCPHNTAQILRKKTPAPRPVKYQYW